MVLPVKRVRRKQNNCPKCGKLKSAEAKQCGLCRKKEQRSTKEQTRKNRYNKCVCGNKKLKHAKKCRNCADEDLRIGRSERNEFFLCPKCGGNKARRSLMCMKCFENHISPVNQDGTITCKECKADKEKVEFYKKKGSEDIKAAICKECYKIKRRRYESYRKCIIYGLSIEESNRIADLKTINCEICNKPTENFHIDHCHNTGKFRGLLCSNCNSGIGILGDDPNRLIKAAKYLNNFNE